MRMKFSMKWKLKLFLELKNKNMDTPLLMTATNDAKAAFAFLNEYGYTLSEFDIKSNEECKMVYTNQASNKEIYISVYNSNEVKRFFITISIVRIPYSSVNDFVSFDVFLTKSKLDVPESLSGDQRNIENANKYFEKYTSLFKEHGIKLITSEQEFPQNFIEWT